ncbi:popeye domain-containing protein 1-like [Styela clava]
MEVRRSEDALYFERVTCEHWSEVQSPIFHLFMAAFLVAFLVPQAFKYYAPVIRASFIVGIFLYMLWGALYWCTWDILMWGAVFFIQNFAQLVYILYNMRRVGLPKDLEILFAEVFQPFGVTRQDFQTLMQHHCKLVKIHSGDKYAVEGCTSVDERVSILVTGRMRVMFRGQFLHDINESEMIDSVEWEGCKIKRGEIFQVTVEAVDRCSYLCWNREKLQYYLEANSDLMTAFQYIRGKDVLSKIRETALNSYRINLKDIDQCEEVDSISVTNIRQGIADEDPNYIYNKQD